MYLNFLKIPKNHDLPTIRAPPKIIMLLMRKTLKVGVQFCHERSPLMSDLTAGFNLVLLYASAIYLKASA